MGVLLRPPLVTVFIFSNLPHGVVAVFGGRIWPGRLDMRLLNASVCVRSFASKHVGQEACERGVDEEPAALFTSLLLSTLLCAPTRWVPALRPHRVSAIEVGFVVVLVRLLCRVSTILQG